MASERQPFKPDDLFRLNTLGEVQIAPDGSRVAYTQTRVDREQDAYRSQIHVAQVDGGRSIRWTNGSHKDSQPRWSPDGRYLAFVRELPDQKPQLYLMPADGGEACRVTDLPHGAGSSAWSPDGRKLAFVAATGDEPDAEDRAPAEKNRPRVVEHLAYRQDGIGYFDTCRSHIWVIEVGDFDPDHLPEPRQITTGDWNDSYPCWSPDGQEVAFVSYREPERFESVFLRGDIWVVTAEGGDARKLTRSRGPAGQPCWSPDGAFIAYAGHEHGYDELARTVHLNIVPAGGGEPRSLTATLDRMLIGPPPFPPSVLAWTPDARGLAFIAMDRGNLTIFHADLDGNIRTLVGGDRQVTGLSLARDGRLAFTASDPNSHTEVYLFDIDSGEERRLTGANRVLAEEVELGRTERIRWPGADGLEIEGWVLKPPGFVEGRRYPAILEIHGGPHGQYGTAFTPGFHAMSGAGYLVIYANPRGSAGYGEDFTRMCVDDWGGKDFEDLMRGVDHVAGLGWADPDRLGVAGYSYGGFMTTWIVGHTQRFKAGVAGACVSNAYSFWGTSDIGTGFGQYEYGGALPHAAPEHYLAGSPVQHLANCVTPLLLLHHEGDLRCPIGQSEEVFAVLKKLGKEAVLVRYPGGYHTYATHAPSQRVDAMQRMNAWFDRFLPEG